MNQVQGLELETAVTSTKFTNKSPKFKYLQDQQNNLRKLLYKTTQEILTKNFLSISPNSPAFEYQDRVKLDSIRFNNCYKLVTR